MTNSNHNEKSNPALELDKLIKQFDRVLGATGVINISHVLTKKGKKSTSDYLADALKTISFIKLQEKYSDVVELVAEIIANVEEEPYFNNIQLPPLPEIGHNNIDNLKAFIHYVAHVREVIQPLINDEVGSNKKNQFLSAIENKKKILDKGFFYEFTDGDLKRIQQIINELRDQIVESDLFEEDHRRRLLRRLEALQSEIHKKMSDVDRIWGLVGDAGIAIGKFGKDSKPFVDRILELSQIAWKTQARAEELPSSCVNPLIESSDND